MLKNLMSLAIAGLFAFGAANAQGTAEAETFVTELVAELRTEAETHGEGSDEVRQTLEENLATDAIGRFLLAGRAADDATEAQRTRYNELFPSYIAAAFAEEIGQLTARTIDVRRSLERGKGDIIVQSVLLDSKGAERADIDWRVRVTDEGELKLLDVLVERTSPLITRRQAFSTRIRDEGMDGLLDFMQRTIDQGIEIEATE